jgi:ligand-binding sensor protein
MELTDIAPLERWIALEDEIFRRTGLNGCVFNAGGTRIAGNRNWANGLCPIIKANEQGQTYICSIAHSHIAAEAQRTRKPVIEECDAGMLKLVVPVFVDDEFLGVIGGCGLLLDDGEVSTILIQKTTGIPENQLEEAALSVKTMTTIEAESIICFINRQLTTIMSDSAKN